MKETRAGTHGSLMNTVRYQDAGSSATGRRRARFPTQAGKAMTSDDDYARLDDPALLAEDEGRVRGRNCRR